MLCKYVKLKAMIVQNKRDIVRGKKDESVNVSKMEIKAG